MKMMNNCVFVDAVGEAKTKIVALLLAIGGVAECDVTFPVETLRFQFEKLPSSKLLSEVCNLPRCLRAAVLRDAELEWLVGGPMAPGRLMWTLTERPIGDPHAPAD